MLHYILSQRYERDYVLFINVEMTLNTPHLMLSMLRTIIHELRQSFGSEVQYISLHCSYICTHWFYKFEWTAIHITLKRNKNTLIVNIYFEWASPHIITVLLNNIHPRSYINRKSDAIRITSVQFVVAILKFIE